MRERTSEPDAYPEEIWMENWLMPVSSESVILKFSAMRICSSGQYGNLPLTEISGGSFSLQESGPAIVILKDPSEKHSSLLVFIILKKIVSNGSTV